MFLSYFLFCALWDSDFGWFEVGCRVGVVFQSRFVGDNCVEKLFDSFQPYPVVTGGPVEGVLLGMGIIHEE